MNTNIFENSKVRKVALGVAGLAFVGGVTAGPAITASLDESARPMSPVASVTEQKPDVAKLTPNGVQGAQQSVDWSEEQVGNAKAIIEATKANGMDERAAVIAVATAMQESTLTNFGHLGDRNDHDSQGLFQQRPSSGWGSVEQITDPQYATTAFLKALGQVDGWEEMPLTAAAQTVQVSAFPDHYAKWEQAAADLVAEHWTS
nr:hypothetical protein [Micromonospora sp. DSM 115978]